jgi:hypothetical protein
MKGQVLLITLLALTVAGAANASPNAVAAGPGQGIVIQDPAPDTICPGSTLKDNTDGSYENGYAWAYQGEVAPYYGAWAEGFTPDLESGTVCGMKFALTQVGAQDGLLMDVYVWDDSGSNPNNVLSVTTGFNPGTIGTWPNITQHDCDIDDVIVPNGGSYFVGWWGTWPGARNGWYVASDENGFGGGLPRTDIAPGIGFPSGWQHPNVVSTFAGCMDLGIGVYELPCPPGASGACCLPDGSCIEVGAVQCEEAGGGWHFCQPCSAVECTPTPVNGSTWGQIKKIYK